MRVPCACRACHAHHAHTVHVPVQAVAQSKGMSWEAQLETLKKNGQWHVEVY